MLSDVLANAGINIPDASFPVIVKKGINRKSESVTFIFNYSMEPADYVITNDCKDLMTGDACKEGARITLSPWGYKIYLGT